MREFREHKTSQYLPQRNLTNARADCLNACSRGRGGILRFKRLAIFPPWQSCDQMHQAKLSRTALSLRVDYISLAKAGLIVEFAQACPGRREYRRRGPNADADPNPDGLTPS